MSSFNYTKICSDLIKGLPDKQKDVLVRRFGLGGKERETLESIGKKYNITRERVRQVERDGFVRLASGAKEGEKAFQYIKQYIKAEGGIKKEDALLSELGHQKEKNQVFFLLNLIKDLKRYSETEDFHPVWALSEKDLTVAQKSVGVFYQKLKKINKPLSLAILNKSINQRAAISYLEASKKIQHNAEGLFGLREWPEINPKGIKDKAFLVLKKQEKPLHFTEVAKLIGPALPQTVHNELIKDDKFVLVGRGTYALREWGYEPGYVRDVISRVIRDAKKPLEKKDILSRVLKQRLVQANTVSLNLSNKRYFQRDPKGRYWVNEA